MDMVNEGAELARQLVARGAEAPRPGEYLTFRVGGDEYGVDIHKVQEIRSYEIPTRIAHAPAFVRGVINLRGIIVPVIDLRIKLACAAADCTDITVVVVLNLRGRVVGAVVDAVSDVIELGAEHLQAPPVVGRDDLGYVLGIASVADRLLVLVDIEPLLGGAEIGLT